MKEDDDSLDDRFSRRQIDQIKSSCFIYTGKMLYTETGLPQKEDDNNATLTFSILRNMSGGPITTGASSMIF